MPLSADENRNSPFQRRGLLFVLSSPSGAGKSTLTKTLMGQDKELVLSVSATTRERRHSEIEGVHYHFVAQDTFQEMIERNQFLEWAEVHGNYYGTPKKPVEEALEKGLDVVFDIDWQGTLQIAEKMKEDVVSIFVLPPSMKELKGRLERRAEDSRETILKRLNNAVTEIAQWHSYDYILINDDLEHVFAQVRAILTAERLKRKRQKNIDETIDRLTHENNTGSES